MRKIFKVLPLKFKMGLAERGFAASCGMVRSTVQDKFKRFGAAKLTWPGVAAERLRAANTRWLHHTHGTLGVRAGIQQSTIRDSPGHASIATTGIYLNDDVVDREREIKKFFGVGYLTVICALQYIALIDLFVNHDNRLSHRTLYLQRAHWRYESWPRSEWTKPQRNEFARRDCCNKARHRSQLHWTLVWHGKRCIRGRHCSMRAGSMR